MPTLIFPNPVLRIPRRFAPLAFGFLMSLTMSGLISLILTAINTGVDAGFLARWLHAYALAWSVAFPSVMIVAPRVRRLVDLLTE